MSWYPITRLQRHVLPDVICSPAPIHFQLRSVLDCKVRGASRLVQVVSKEDYQHERPTLAYFLGKCGFTYGKRMRGWFVQEVQGLDEEGLSVACTDQRKVSAHPSVQQGRLSWQSKLNKSRSL